MNTEKPNTFILFDGSVIQGYPKVMPSSSIDNDMSIDTTGRYLIVGNQTPKPLPPTSDEEKAQEKLFFENAFKFLYHREAILNDSRLFLTPLPFRSVLAYTGEGGFRCPTLGVYIEWWMNCPASIVELANGEVALLYQISGTPLSGSNSCGVVGVDGSNWREQIGNFSSAYGYLLTLNRHYDDAKEKYQAYTLSEAVEMVKSLPPRPIPFEYDLQMVMMHREIVYLKKLHDKDMRYAFDQDQKITQLIVEANYETFKTLYLEYTEAHKSAEEEIAEAYEERIRLRKLLKDGVIDNKEYQNRLRPINKIIHEKLLDAESEFSHRLYEISSDVNLRKLSQYFTLHPIQMD